ADVLKFGHGSVLLSNDACSVKVVALEINHTQVTPDGAAPALVESIDVELAAMHGTTQRHSVTDDMVVSPLSQKHDTNPSVSLVPYLRSTGKLEILDWNVFDSHYILRW
ncbi:MAG: hypothetical protein AAF653_17110, partial [Chloroflexota bacterium]